MTSGTPAMTTRGFKPADFEFTAEKLVETLEIAKKIARESDPSTPAFRQKCWENNELLKIRKCVVRHVSKYPMVSSKIW